MSEAYPRLDQGFFHLTDNGWVRQDSHPYPPGRVETWKYEMECDSKDAKEQVCLTKVWSNPNAPMEHVASMHRQFGVPVRPAIDRNVKLECQV
ncbi:MAG: hypothetical protein V4527_13395 [Pseudomonadota bacterium]